MTSTLLTDVQCGYHVLGHGDPLLLVPGLGTTCRVWDPATPDLSAHFSLILPDNRGMGCSTALRCPETLSDYVSDLVELMDHLQLDKAHVLGLSLGGMIARKLATDHPSRVDRLVLVSCTDRSTPYLKQVMQLLGNILRRLPAEAFAQAIETLGTSPIYFDAHAAEIQQRVRDRCAAGNEVKGIITQLRCLKRESDHCDEHAVVTAPTLVMAGEYDPLVPSCYALAMADRIAGSRFMLVRGAGHNLLQEASDRVLPPIIEFLSQPTGDEGVSHGEGRRSNRRERQSRTEGAHRVEIIE